MRPEKASIVSDLSEQLNRSPFVLVADYQHMKVGLVDRAVVSAAELEKLADLPSREVLLAQLLGLIQAPATRLARMLNEPASSLARLVKAKPENEGEATPAEAAPT